MSKYPLDNPNLEFKRVPANKQEELKLKKKQLTKLLKTAKLMTPIIADEDKGQTEHELKLHNEWIDSLKQQIKDLSKLNV
jgi:hypothetical protein